jgi:hypothetical protein
MSYDLEIRSDDRYSESKPVDEVRRAIAATADVSPNVPDGFMIDRTEAGIWISMDVSFAGADGDRVDPPPPDRNVVDMYVPAAHFDRSQSHLFTVAAEIARRLGWRVYDPQVGRYLDE